MNKEIDRFDLESQIMSVWSILEELEIVQQRLDQIDDRLNSDQGVSDASDMINGIRKIWAVKFENLWVAFESMIRDEKII